MSHSILTNPWNQLIPQEMDEHKTTHNGALQLKKNENF